MNAQEAAAGAPDLDLYYWPTPNGWKITILLEELAAPYNLIPVDIRKGGQFDPEFLAISPSNKIPALVDRNPGEGREPISIFESAAIMMYLAERFGRFWPTDLAQRYEVVQWLAWQIASLGPTAGQVHHFLEYAPAQVPYAQERFTNEIGRLYGVLDKRLRRREFLAETYSIADIACWVWIRLWKHHRQDLDMFPDLRRWLESLAARPALNRGFRIGNELREGQTTMTPEARRILLGSTTQTAVSRRGTSRAT